MRHTQKSSLTTICLFFLLIFSQSCKKETVVESDLTPITPALLSANKIMIKELRGVLGGNKIYYLRGATSGNTQSFDNEYYKFNADFTGTNLDGAGTLKNFTWVFTNSENTKINITLLNTPATFVVTWDNMRYINSTLYYDEYFTDGNTGLHAHSQGIRIPKP